MNSKAAIEETAKKMGLILDVFGRGGSGICVESPNGAKGVLTATHVVLPCVLSAELSVSSMSLLGGRSKEPRWIRSAARADAAAVFLGNDFAPKAFLGAHEWDPEADPGVSIGETLVAFGVPGEWRDPPNLETKTIGKIPVLPLPCRVTNENWSGLLKCTGNLVECSFDPEGDLPKSFKGMSGGPVFNLQGKLVGLIAGERGRGTPAERLYFTRRSRFKDLYHPFQTELDDYINQPFKVVLTVSHFSNDLLLKVNIFIEEFWSVRNSAHEKGRLGRTTYMTVGDEPSTTRFRINVESVFKLPELNTEEQRLSVALKEAKELLDSMGYLT